MAYWEPEGFYRLGQGEYAGITAGEVLKRLHEAAGTSSMSELANWLDARPSWLSDAKRRNIMPVRWIQMLIIKHSAYSPLWVLSGRGEKLMDGWFFTLAGLRRCSSSIGKYWQQS